jgi:hypothetical protein
VPVDRVVRHLPPTVTRPRLALTSPR